MGFKRHILMLGVLLAGAGVRGAELAELVKAHANATAMLTARSLVLTRQGHVAAAYPVAAKVFTAADALDRVQAAYAELLPPGEKPEFRVTSEKAGVYSYINRDKQTSVVEEVWKAGDAEGFDVVFYVTGERFFGRFRALIHLHATPAARGEIDYGLLVRASPDNAVWRFVVSRLGLVRTFFRSKTAEVSALAERICARLCPLAPAQPQQRAESVRLK